MGDDLKRFSDQECLYLFKNPRILEGSIEMESQTSINSFTDQ